MLQVEPFDRDQTTGRPLIPADGVGLYRFGALIRGCEQLLLDLFRRDQVSGTVHTCLGQELCQMSVVRALCDPEDAVSRTIAVTGTFSRTPETSLAWSPR